MPAGRQSAGARGVTSDGAGLYLAPPFFRAAFSEASCATEMRPAWIDRAKTVDAHWLRPSTDKAPRLQVERTSYGFHYVAIRRPIMNSATHGPKKRDLVGVHTVFRCASLRLKRSSAA